MPDTPFSSPSLEPAPTASARTFIATFAVLFALILAFLALDLFLARIEQTETHRHASDLYAEGRTLLANGNAHDAADRLATAVSLERRSVPHALGHAQAMLAEGHSADAEQALNDLLLRAQNDGAVNLTMARLLATTSRPRDAKAFYHRAIFGTWGSDSTNERMTARFELIDLLAHENARTELLAELLALQGAPADSTKLLTRVAPLYLRAGSPSRAMDAYRQLLHRNPDDASAHVGVGEAALALGQYQVARSAFTSAERELPGDSSVVARRALVDTLIALDPNARGLGDATRLARSTALLARAVASLAACAPALPSTELDSARAVLLGNNPRGDAVAMMDDRLGRASALWRLHTVSCPAVRDDVLAHLLSP